MPGTVVREGTKETHRNACLPRACILGDRKVIKYTVHWSEIMVRTCWVGCGFRWVVRGGLTVRVMLR